MPAGHLTGCNRRANIVVLGDTWFSLGGEDMRKPAILLGLVLLTACAGRDAKPVAVMNAYDRDLSCEQIQAEIQSNETKARQLVDEQSSSRNANIAVGAVGVLLFWPALFALDLSDAERVEINALHQRNMHLANLARDCSAVASAGSRITTARAIRTGAYDGKWTGEGADDGCGSAWAMVINVKAGEARGMLWRGRAEYNFEGRVDREGQLQKLLAGKTPASNGIVGPRFITVNAALGDETASGDYSMAAPGPSTCTVVVTLDRHQA